MAVAGRQPVAVFFSHHAAIAPGRSRRHHFSIRGRAYWVARCCAEIEAGVHGRPTEERIAANPEAGREFDYADHRLAIRHQRKGPVETLYLDPGVIDPVELALESACVGWKLDWNVGTTHARTWRRSFQLRHIETEIGKEAAHAAYTRFHTIFDRAKRRHLAARDLIERTLQADPKVLDALNLGKLIRLGPRDDRGSRFQAGFAVPGRPQKHGHPGRRA